jgi:predicted phosphodiesterase
MRVALLSDIHGNVCALRAVLADCRAQGIEALWVLGDILGYGPLPVSCVRLLDHHRPAIWLMGNHDLAGLRLWEGIGASNTEIYALTPGLTDIQMGVWHAEQLKEGLSEDRVKQWRQAPTWAQAQNGVYVAHGAILSPDPAAHANVIGENSYVKPGSAGADLTLDTLKDKVADPAARPWLVVVGHSHMQLFCHTSSPWQPPRQWIYSDEIDDLVRSGDYLDPNDLPGHVFMVCPGSVGQPRDPHGDPRAAYAILDPETRKVQFRRVEYDVPEILAALVVPPIEIIGLAQIRARLARGWVEGQTVTEEN